MTGDAGLRRDDHIIPELRAARDASLAQPPAPDMSAAQLYIDASIYPKLTVEAQKRLQELITPNLKLNATKYASSELVRDSARKSVEKFLKSRFSGLAEDLKRKQLVVRFEGEN